MLQVIKQKLQHLYQINRSNDSSARVLSKNLTFYKKVNKVSFEWKSMFFCFFPLQIFFVTHGHIPPIFNFLTWFFLNYHIAKAPTIPKHIFKAWKPNQKLILCYGKVRETYLTSVKKVNILSFLGTKSCLTEKNKVTNIHFSLEILKVVCLRFDWVPKLIQKSFQTREQNIVQRCETMVGADACWKLFECMRQASNNGIFCSQQCLVLIGWKTKLTF